MNKQWGVAFLYIAVATAAIVEYFQFPEGHAPGAWGLFLPILAILAAIFSIKIAIDSK